MMSSSLQVVEQSRRVAVQFLIAELNLALTFLDVAGTTERDETRKRNEQNAQTAYFTALRILTRVEPSDEEQPTVQRKLAEVKDSLHSLGYALEAEPENPAAD